MRTHLHFAWGWALAAPLACSVEPTTAYGPPDGIAGRTPPEPSSTATGAPSGTGTGTRPPPARDAGGPPSMTGVDSSTPPAPTGDSAAPPLSTADAGEGSSMPMGSACAVSWSSAVYPLLQSSGRGQCASVNCHGGASTPAIFDGDSAGTYATLAAYSLNGHAYISAGDTTPANSAIECNLGVVQPACGALPMPAAPGSLTATDLQTIDAWIRCGAPQN